MAILDTTFFTGEINIPGLAQDWNSESLAAFITKYENEYIYKAMGYELGKAFISGIADDPVAARWQAILTGAEYTTESGKLRKFDGLTPDGGACAIADYVYYMYQRDNVSLTTTTGEVIANKENGKSFGSMQKMCRAWNEMSAITDKLREYLECALDGEDLLYPEYDSSEIYEFGTVNVMNL